MLLLVDPWYSMKREKRMITANPILLINCCCCCRHRQSKINKKYYMEERVFFFFFFFRPTGGDGHVTQSICTMYIFCIRLFSVLSYYWCHGNFSPPLWFQCLEYLCLFFFFLLMFWVTTISVCGAGQQNLYPVRRRRKNFFPTKKGKHKRKKIIFFVLRIFCCVAVVTGILWRCMGVCFFARVPFSAVFYFSLVS